MTVPGDRVRAPRAVGAHRAERPSPVSDVAELAGRHGVELLRFAYLVCGDRQRAEDLLQDALLALHRRFDDGLRVDNPVGYARRTIVNTHISWTRRSMNTEVATDVLPERIATDPGIEATTTDRDLLWQALRRLPVRQRTALVLRFYADAADDDIADALDCRSGTVRSLLSRGLSALRDDPTLDFVPAGGAS